MNVYIKGGAEQLCLSWPLSLPLSAYFRSIDDLCTVQTQWFVICGRCVSVIDEPNDEPNVCVMFLWAGTMAWEQLAVTTRRI